MQDLKLLASASFSIDAGQLPSFHPVIDLDADESNAKRRRISDPSVRTTLRLYIRQMRYSSPAALQQELEMYKTKFPGDAVWASFCLLQLKNCSSSRMLFLQYAGLTVRSAVTRLGEDQKTEYRRWANWNGEFAVEIMTDQSSCFRSASRTLRARH